MAKETDIAKPVIAWLMAQHWDVYQEVCTGQASAIADIVAVQAGIAWIIEVKTSMSLALLAQANPWLASARFTSVAVPAEKPGRYRLTSSTRQFAYDLCHRMGLGVIVVRPDDGVEQTVAPRVQRAYMRGFDIRTHLREEQKTWAEAGSRVDQRWSPFQQTCRAVLEKVTTSPGLTFKQLIDGLAHHYAKDSTAHCCLRQWIHRGKVRGVECRRDGRQLRVYPSKPHPTTRRAE